jgi:hypothetical protein
MALRYFVIDTYSSQLRERKDGFSIGVQLFTHLNRFQRALSFGLLFIRKIQENHHQFSTLEVLEDGTLIIWSCELDEVFPKRKE